MKTTDDAQQSAPTGLGWRVTRIRPAPQFGPNAGVWTAIADYHAMTVVAVSRLVAGDRPPYSRHAHAEGRDAAVEAVLTLCRADAEWPLMAEKEIDDGAE